MAIAAISSTALSAPEEVILLHGLCRTSHSMVKMERVLTNAGYQVKNVSYPSHTASIQPLADDAIGKAVTDCQQDGAVKIHFVTHSLGGILVRSYLARHSVPSLGRVVMLVTSETGQVFSGHYYEAMQRDADVVLMHAEVIKLHKPGKT